MRLAILNSGHRFWSKVLFALIRVVSRLPVADAVKVNRYRPDFYGTPMGVVAQEAMRGPSAWSVGDRELMGASVSKMNECECCTKTHASVAALAYQDEARVSAALSDLETAAIDEPLRATLVMLRKLTREHAVPKVDAQARAGMRGGSPICPGIRRPWSPGRRGPAAGRQRVRPGSPPACRACGP
jgi:AhpD family alkylhydroperoxidase